MGVRMSWRIGRKEMSHRVRDGKLEHFIRSWSCLHNDVGEPDWDLVDDVIDSANNPNALELHISFKVNTSENQK